MSYYTRMVATYGSINHAARATGIARTTFQDRLAREKVARMTSTITSSEAAVSMTELPEERPPIDEILKRIESDFENKKGLADAKSWFEVNVRDNGPFGLMVWGDPHLDSPGCDIPLLRHHMALARHPHVFSVNIGDTLDGWVGRLTKLYRESRIDVHTARELAMWFMREVRWILWLAGNHDMWEDNEAILRLMSQQSKVRLLPWEAKFRLVFPNGSDVKVHAAHDFPGRSMYNVNHGGMRAARYTSPGDIILSGHIHDWGSSLFEMAGFDGRCPLSVRVRGYKTIDEYAMVRGYQSARYGSSCLIIIDPNVEGPGRTHVCWDIAQGVDMLDALSSRYKTERRRAPPDAVLPVQSPAAAPAGRKQAVRPARRADRPGAAKKPAAR